MASYLFFSGLVAQSEISWLLDRLYGSYGEQLLAQEQLEQIEKEYSLIGT